MYDLVGNHQFIWLGVFSLISFIATLIAVPAILVRIPADYFIEKKDGEGGASSLLTLLCKNILGFIFLVLGIVMLFTPGQGILTILIGLSLLNFPGKRRLEINIIRRPQVQSAINWLRSKYSKPPLLIP